MQVQKGQPVKLQIEFTADPLPNITWTKDGKEVKEDEHLKISLETQELEHGLKKFVATLTFTDAKHFDTGKYEMKASNKHGELSTLGYLDVLSKPEIVGLKDQMCLPYDTVVFDAIVYANPKPKVVWTRNGENLCNNENWEVIADVDAEKYRLVLQTAQVTDGGRYTITATNAQGTTTQDFKLKMNGEFILYLHRHIFLLRAYEVHFLLNSL